MPEEKPTDHQVSGRGWIGPAFSVAGSAVFQSAVLVAVCTCLYFSSLQGMFVYTDEGMIFGDAAIAGGASGDAYGGVGQGLAGFEWSPGRPPVPQLYFALLRLLFGRLPFGFHIGCVAAHAVCAVVLLLFLRTLLISNKGGTAAAFAGALFFCGHPVAAAGASWISASGDVLCALLALSASLLFFIDLNKPKQNVNPLYALSVVLFMGAALSAGWAAAWVLMFAALYIFSMVRGGGLKENGGRALKLLPFIAAGVFCFIVYYRNGGYVWPGVSAALCAAGRNIKDVIAPVGLGPVTVPVCGGVWLKVIGGAMVAFCTVAAVFAAVRGRGAFVGVLAAMFLAAVVGQVLCWREWMADARSYMLAAVVSAAAGRVLTRGFFAGGNRQRMLAGAIVVAGAAVWLCTLGYGQTKYYERNMDFWAPVAQENPKESRAWFMLARGQMSAARSVQAIESLTRAVALEPGNERYRLTLGSLYMRLGKFTDARKQFAAAISISPRNAYYHSGIAATYFETGRYQEAYAEMAIAVKLEPDSPELKKGLEAVLKQAKKKQVQIYTEGVTDDFFRMLREMESGEKPKR